MQRIGGILSFKVDGQVMAAKGNFTYDVGDVERTSVMGADGMHGFTEAPIPAFIEGEITLVPGITAARLKSLTNITVSLELGDRTITLSRAFAAGQWTANTEEGNMSVRFEAPRGREIV